MPIFSPCLCIRCPFLPNTKDIELLKKGIIMKKLLWILKYVILSAIMISVISICVIKLIEPQKPIKYRVDTPLPPPTTEETPNSLEANSHFSSLSNAYDKALKYISNRRYPQAIWILNALGDYNDSEELVANIRYSISNSFLAAKSNMIVAVTRDHRVIAISRNPITNAIGTTYVKNFEHVKSLSVHGYTIEGITESGDFVTNDKEMYNQLYPGAFPPTETTPKTFATQSPLPSSSPSMKDLLLDTKKSNQFSSFSCYCSNWFYGLTTDNELCILNKELSDSELSYIHSTWKNVVQLTGRDGLLGLTREGTVLSSFQFTKEQRKQLAGWTDIVYLQQGPDIFGLKSNGTVLSLTGMTASWHDITSISASSKTIVGIRSDGSVVAAGDNSLGQCEVSDWRNIVAICATSEFTVGLTSDGTLITTKYETAPDVSFIQDLYVP